MNPVRTFLFLLLICLAGIAEAQHKIKRYDAIVRTERGVRYKGLLERVDENGLTIRFHKNPTYIAADSVRTIRIKKYNAQNRSFLAGGLAGLAAGMGLYAHYQDKGDVNAAILPVVVISSAVTGATVAGIINSLTAVEKFKQVGGEGNFNAIREKLKPYALYR